MLLLTLTLYFLRALPTFTARCATINTLAAPVNTTYPYSLDRTTILAHLEEEINTSKKRVLLLKVKTMYHVYVSFQLLPNF